MKLNSALSLAILFISLSSSLQAQSFKDYTFKKDVNEIIADQNYDFVVAYKIISKQYADTTITASTKSESKEYKDLSASFRRDKRKVKAIEAKIKAEENTVDPFVADLSILKKSVNDFLVSQSAFDSKKHLLITSQKISDNYGLGYLLYADSNVNSKFKTKFFVLSKNKVALKIHLKKIAAKIKSVEAPTPVRNNYDEELNAAKRKLKSTRDRLNRTKQYNIIEGKSSIKRYAEVKIGDRVFKPENVIVGNFELLSEYYIIRDASNNFKMISVEKAQLDKLTHQDFVHKSKFIAVKNKFSKETFLVHNKFIVEQYAYTKNEPRSVEDK